MTATAVAQLIPKPHPSSAVSSDKKRLLAVLEVESGASYHGAPKCIVCAVVAFAVLCVGAAANGLDQI